MKSLVVLEGLEGELPASEIQALKIALISDHDETIALSLSPLNEDTHRHLEELGLARLFELNCRFANSLDSEVVVTAIEQVTQMEPRIKTTIGHPASTIRDAFGRLAIRNSTEVLGSVSNLRLQKPEQLEAEVFFDGGRRTAQIQINQKGHGYYLIDPSPRRFQSTSPRNMEIIRLAEPSHPPRVRKVHTEKLTTDEIATLQTASFIVAGGRGMGSHENLQKLESWALSMGATFGSSRAPVEDRWISYDRLIGQTGTMIAPELYLAFGISGAPQHLSGVRGSKRIVAINSDPTAPIAREADLLIVADANAIVATMAQESQNSTTSP